MKLVDLVLDSASQKKKKKYSSRLFPIYGTKTRAALLAGSILAVLCLVFAFTLYYLSSPAGGGRKATIKIEPQSSTGEIATKLHDSGMIHSAAYFKLYAQLTGADTSLKAGKYVFQGTENLAEIIRELQKGTPEISSFTVPEGYTLEQITNLLDSKGIVPRAEFMAALKESQVSFPYLKELPEGQNRFEGFLFPDTYNVTEGMEAGEIIQMMLDKFSKIYTLEMRKRAEELNLTTKQVVTLASIIEREAQKPEDRPLVSAVFHNRLKINMALNPVQQCSTL